MKIGEALSLLKKERSKLSRLISLRKDNVYVEEGKQPKFNPKILGEEIIKKIEEIRKLKIRIQKSNLDVKVAGENISLAEAIIKINDIRSKIAALSNLFEKKSSWLYRSKEEKDMAAQLDEKEIEEEIESLEIEKIQLDNKIQVTNWTAQLLDK